LRKPFAVIRLPVRHLTDQQQSSLSCGKLTPFGERGSAVLLEGIAAVEVAFLIAVIMDQSLDGLTPIESATRSQTDQNMNKANL